MFHSFPAAPHSIFYFIIVAACAPKPLSGDAVAAKPGEGDVVLAAVDGREIRLAHFQFEQTLAHSRVMGRFRSDAKQVDLVASLADREVLFAEGWKREAIREHPVVKGAIARAFARELVAAEVARSGAQEVVTEAEMRAEFDARKDEWREPARVRIRSILRLWAQTDVVTKRREQRALLERVRAEAKAGKAFAALATEHNEDAESRAEGGDLGWFDVGSDLIPDGARELRAVGEVSGVAEVENGLRIYAVTETADTRILPFESARETIRRDIVFNRVRDRLVATLRAK